MNRNLLLAGPLLLALAVLPSCNKDDDDAIDVNTQNVSNTVLEDSWMVTYFLDDDNDDETSKFTDYRFTFNADGTVSATRSANVKAGTWLVRQDDGRTELELDFNDNDDPLNKLDEDLEVVSLTNVKIILRDLDDDGDDDDEYLTFEKI